MLSGSRGVYDGLGQAEELTFDHVCQGCNLIRAGDTGDDVADAGELLHEDHGADEAVVAGRVLDVHLVLQHPACGGHALGKAAKHLHTHSLIGPRQGLLLVVLCCRAVAVDGIWKATRDPSYVWLHQQGHTRQCDWKWEWTSLLCAPSVQV